MEEIFTDIYENKIWGDNNNLEYSGSSGESNNINNQLILNLEILNHLVFHHYFQFYMFYRAMIHKMYF